MAYGTGSGPAAEKQQGRRLLLVAAGIAAVVLLVQVAARFSPAQIEASSRAWNFFLTTLLTGFRSTGGRRPFVPYYRFDAGVSCS